MECCDIIRYEKSMDIKDARRAGFRLYIYLTDPAVTGFASFRLFAMIKEGRISQFLLFCD